MHNRQQNLRRPLRALLILDDKDLGLVGFFDNSLLLAAGHHQLLAENVDGDFDHVALLLCQHRA